MSLNLFGTILFFLCLSWSGVRAQPAVPTGASELSLAIRQLGVLGSALYVAAHPDDENTAVIAALSRGALLRTGYLSMTRGEGGQNLLGSEQGAGLGILRTQELLEARRIDGGVQFFTSAIDFGYSKTSEETIRLWGRRRIVGDIVWVIRKFRPDIVITRFSDTLGTHGNHTSSAILTREAFEAAGDPREFPEQLDLVEPWRPTRLVFNTFRFGSSGRDPGPFAVAMDVGEYNILLGLSHTEISGKSRSMHKSQGFGAAENRGRSLQYFEPVAGRPARKGLMDDIDPTWSRVPGGDRVRPLIEAIIAGFDPARPARSIPQLVSLYRLLGTMQGDPWIAWKRDDVRDLILGCAGISLEALAARFSATPGDSVDLTVVALNRSEVPVRLTGLKLPWSALVIAVDSTLRMNLPVRIPAVLRIPREQPVSQPYWLWSEPDGASYRVDDRTWTGTPEGPQKVASLSLEIGGETFAVDVPVRFSWVDPVQGQRSRAFIVVPGVSVQMLDPVLVFTDGEARDVRLMVTRTGSAGEGMVKLDAPRGWVVAPSSQPFRFGDREETVSLMFSVRPESAAASGRLRAVATVGDRSVSTAMITVDYPHIEPQVYFQEAAAALVRMPMNKKPQGLIGYIQGPGDEVPPSLRQIGYSVKMLSDDELMTADLDGFDAIMAGVRAYNTRPALRMAHDRLMKYIRQGGRYVVQYVTQQRSGMDNIGPYPFSISRNRVTVEQAPVSFPDPNHPLLTVPNRITAEDFEGWVQERGLYFAGTWDKSYTTVIESNDPGEPPTGGGLLFARYGKGSYVYTGYSFFRQLPAGVPGAYRWIVNLLTRN